MSDLHLEFDANLDLPGGDIAILAGDIWLIRHMQDGSDDDHRGYEAFCKRQLSKYERVLLTYGNHEPYGALIDDVEPVITAFLAKHAANAQLLINRSVEIDGVAFLGSPLWATCGATSERTRKAIRGGMNDFQLIRTKHEASEGIQERKMGDARIFDPLDANRLHQDAVGWLEAELPKHKRCVVFTHHAPSFMSAGGGHAKDKTLDSAYCSNLHELIEANPQIHTWIHGHTHRHENYRVGNTRIIANPRGYVGHERIAYTFDASAADFDTEEV
jgi:hypothetical protein